MIEIDKNKYFILFACCKPVRGAARSIICDLQRNSFIYITNDVFDMVSNSFSLLRVPDKNRKKNIIEVINYLIENEFGFITSEPENFPNINFSLNDYPEIIKNSIIDFDRNSNHNLLSVVDQLSELRCSAVELRFFDIISKDLFIKYLMCFEKSTIRTLDIILQFSNWTTLENIDKIFVLHKRLSKVIVCNSQEIRLSNPSMQSLIYFSTNKIDSALCCGNILPYYFQSNIEFFKEALTSNPCLDKKICVDSRGYLKNCPAMEKTYGHINDTKLKKCIENYRFKKLWNIKKDNIEVCKDCEFRYICPDCRAFTQSNNYFSKPKKCNYDPYTNSWS